MATAYDYGRLIKAVLLPAPLAQKPIDQIDDGDINRFLGELMKRKGLNGPQIGPRRINMMIARLRTIFSTAKRHKLIAEDPMPYIKNLSRAKGRRRPVHARRGGEDQRSSDRPGSYVARCAHLLRPTYQGGAGASLARR